MTMSQASIKQLAMSAGLNESRAGLAAAIAMAESSGDPNAHNAKPPDDSYGLWQINMLGAMGPARRKQFGISDDSQLYNPETNAKAMAQISQQGGNFAPWSTYTNGAYRQFLIPSLGPVPGTTPATSSGSGNWLDKILPGSPVGDINTAVSKTSAWVSNSENWLRVGYVVGGSVIVIVGLTMIIGSTSAGRTIGNLIPTGKAAKVAKLATAGGK